jgi:putative PIG3 family NAD(P)H quinone oxidoreductase
VLAIVITGAGGPEVLEVREVQTPQPAPDEVLVRIHAAGLNRADLLQREGKYPAPPGSPADIPGLEFAGEVAALGARARLWREGQRVFGLAGGGAYAQYIVAHERASAEIPANLSWADAAAIPEAFITAQDAMWTQARLRPGETVLITAVGSGVGLAAVQLCRAVGAEPYGTSRTADKIERARQWGLMDGAIVSDPLSELAPQVQKWTAGHGIDVMIDLVGGPYVRAGLEVLAPKGRLVVVGTTAGRRAEIELGYLMSKRLEVRGTVLRARPLEEKIEAVQRFAREVVPLLARGVVKPVIDSEFAFRDVAQAHERLQSNATFGKVVLHVAEKA